MSVIAAVGHVRDEEGAARSTAHGAGVMEHFVDGDGQGIFVAEHDHAERIADEDDVHAGFVNQARGRIVVSREAGDFLGVRESAGGFGFPLEEFGHGDFAVPGLRDNAHGGLRCRSLNAGYSPVLHLCKE